MEVDYALITSSALPEQVKSSSSFMHIDEEQWNDLLLYSKELAPSSAKEKVMVLIVAQGTPEEEKLEQEKLEQEAIAKEELQRLKAFEQEKLLEEQEKQKNQEKLRSKSKEILNAIYGR